MLRLADKPFIVVREEALCLMCEEGSPGCRDTPGGEGGSSFE